MSCGPGCTCKVCELTGCGAFRNLGTKPPGGDPSGEVALSEEATPERRSHNDLPPCMMPDGGACCVQFHAQALRIELFERQCTEHEENAKAYEAILGKRSYQQVYDEIAALTDALKWMRNRDDKNGSLPKAYRDKVDEALGCMSFKGALEG